MQLPFVPLWAMNRKKNKNIFMNKFAADIMPVLILHFLLVRANEHLITVERYKRANGQSKSMTVFYVSLIMKRSNIIIIGI